MKTMPLQKRVDKTLMYETALDTTQTLVDQQPPSSENGENLDEEREKQWQLTFKKQQSKIK